MAERIEITSQGVKSVLDKFSPEQAVAEYIWNGFDSSANTVNVNYTVNELGKLITLEITDNGSGIPLDKLKQKFKKFHESEKARSSAEYKHLSLPHGRRGYGRLTFFKFAYKANWKTIFEDKSKGKRFEYYISIQSNVLDTYEGIAQNIKEVTSLTGTTVSFEGLDIFESEFLTIYKNHLIKEFGWFLELNKGKDFHIYINNEALDYSSIIKDPEPDSEFEVIHEPTNTKFKCKFVQWTDNLKPEESHYYYIDANGKEKYKEHTRLNRQGDQFYHSVYITSEYFNNFDFNNIDDSQQPLLDGNVKDDQYKHLQKEVLRYIKQKRKPHLKDKVEQLISSLEAEKVLPKFKDNEWDNVRKDNLISVVKGMYKVQPKVFTSLNREQKITFLGFLNLLLDNDERDNILEILKEIVDLQSEEREELKKLFGSTRLSRIIKTIKLIEDRYKTVDMLNQMVFKSSLNANEVKHIQKTIESHYWILGEQYNLVTAAEPKFEEALTRHRYILTGIKKKKTIEHPDKNKEMDIFACRQNIQTDTIDNIIVELKHPDIKLGNKQLDQVKKYLGVIESDPECHASNMKWEFYLIGKSFDSTGYIEREIKSAKVHGERSLVYSADNFKIYVKTWLELFNEFECKHKFLNDKLKLEKDKLIAEGTSADLYLEELQASSAASIPEVIIQG